MKSVFAKSILTLAAGVGAFSIPSFAKADHRVEVRVVGHEEVCAPKRIWIDAVYENRSAQVWVEPVYRTECVRVFVNEYVETKSDRVWVLPVFEVRDVVRFEHGRRVIIHERVCVREGTWKNVESRVVVPAHYRNEDHQVLVTPGHFETRTDRVCVREGHWDGVEIAPRLSFGIGFRGHF